MAMQEEHIMDIALNSKNYCWEKSVINPSFLGIVSFRGDDRIMSVSKGGEPDFEEFNLSSLYQISQK
jgi:hypothetical protein